MKEEPQSTRPARRQIQERIFLPTPMEVHIINTQSIEMSSGVENILGWVKSGFLIQFLGFSHTFNLSQQGGDMGLFYKYRKISRQPMETRTIIYTGKNDWEQLCSAADSTRGRNRLHCQSVIILITNGKE